MTVDIIWKRIPISQSEICLAKVLRCGQTFRWKNINDVWSFALKDRVVLLKQDDENIHYSHILGDNVNQINNNKTSEETLTFLNDYFNLSTNLQLLYDYWINQHEIWTKPVKYSPFTEFKGIRIVRQDPWECLISFICSSNNNVKRISKMCDNLCQEFGEFVTEYQGRQYHSFPTPQQLAQPNVEAKLRLLGFGYRAKYIYQTALKLTDISKPDISIEKLYKLRDEDYMTAHKFLLQLTGVGPKVADCICLMALDKHEVVPVDTHVYQIAIRDYKFKGKRDMKSLSKQQYEAIRLYFKQIFGDYAGWAQSVLFASDLSDLNNGVNQKSEILESKHIIEMKAKKTVKVEV